MCPPILASTATLQATRTDLPLLLTLTLAPALTPARALALTTTTTTTTATTTSTTVAAAATKTTILPPRLPPLLPLPPGTAASCCYGDEEPADTESYRIGWATQRRSLRRGSVLLVGGACETITCMLDIHAKHACASHSLCSHSHKGEVGRGGQAFKAAGRESTQTADDLGGEDKLRCLGGATIHRNIART